MERSKQSVEVTNNITPHLDRQMQNIAYFLMTILIIRGGSKTDATSKIERFVIIVNGWKPSTIITKCSILNVPAALDPFLIMIWNFKNFFRKRHLKMPPINGIIQVGKLETILVSNVKAALRDMCPNENFFLVRIFLYSEWKRGLME